MAGGGDHSANFADKKLNFCDDINFLCRQVANTILP